MYLYLVLRSLNLSLTNVFTFEDYKMILKFPSGYTIFKDAYMSNFNENGKKFEVQSFKYLNIFIYVVVL